MTGDPERDNRSLPYRVRREHTDEWASIKQWMLWPEQELYEAIRPIILYGQTAGERAKEINAAQRTLSRKADEFERDGMQSLFAEHSPREQGETSRTLPPDMRQLIVDLHAEAPYAELARNRRGMLHSLWEKALS